MNKIKPRLVIAALSLLSPMFVSAQSLSPLQQKVQAVMGMDHRTDAELARDADRDPVAARWRGAGVDRVFGDCGLVFEARDNTEMKPGRVGRRVHIREYTRSLAKMRLSDHAAALSDGHSHHICQKGKKPHRHDRVRMLAFGISFPGWQM